MLERDCAREKLLEKQGKAAKARARREAMRTAEPHTRVTEKQLQQLEDDIRAAAAQAMGS